MNKENNEAVPTWFSSISWSVPLTVETLRSKRQYLPDLPGVYVFTNYADPLKKNSGVLYVGMAKSLANRVVSYLVDPGEMRLLSSRSGPPRLNSSLAHAGKVQLLVKLQQKSTGSAPSGICIRWHQTNSPGDLEKLLLAYLRPAFNTYGVGSKHLT